MIASLSIISIVVIGLFCVGVFLLLVSRRAFGVVVGVGLIALPLLLGAFALIIEQVSRAPQAIQGFHASPYNSGQQPVMVGTTQVAVETPITPGVLDTSVPPLSVQVSDLERIGQNQSTRTRSVENRDWTDPAWLQNPRVTETVLFSQRFATLEEADRQLGYLVNAHIEELNLSPIVQGSLVFSDRTDLGLFCESYCVIELPLETDQLKTSVYQMAALIKPPEEIRREVSAFAARKNADSHHASSHHSETQKMSANDGMLTTFAVALLTITGCLGFSWFFFKKAAEHYSTETGA